MKTLLRSACLFLLATAFFCEQDASAQQFGGYASRRVLLELNGNDVKARQLFQHTLRKPEQCTLLLGQLERLWPSMRVISEGCSPITPPPPGYVPEAEDVEKHLYVEYRDSRFGEEVVKARTIYYLEAEHASRSETCPQLLAAFHAGQIGAKCHSPRRQ